VARVLAALGLEARARTRIRALSGGMRQRLGIAQALLGGPELLILDEPTAGLDPEQRLRFRELLSGLPGDPAIVLSTHQADDIAAICPQVVVLLEGRVQFAGTPAGLAGTAAGQVWAADERDSLAHLSWRGGDGRWRHIGEHCPAGAELVPPRPPGGQLGGDQNGHGQEQLGCADPPVSPPPQRLHRVEPEPAPDRQDAGQQPGQHQHAADHEQCFYPGQAQHYPQPWRPSQPGTVRAAVGGCGGVRAMERGSGHRVPAAWDSSR
ncbi:MAG TPA: ATP-binding cassette domain-containing protein, partial [Streptosporangiaceae bacterium]|nr:ATP-binding cassette domain-containing protein [Streptosporangiaceae bacterium]